MLTAAMETARTLIPTPASRLAAFLCAVWHQPVRNATREPDLIDANDWNGRTLFRTSRQ